MWKLCLSGAAWAMSKPRAVRPAAPVPAALIFRKSRRVTCGTQFLQGKALQATKRQPTHLAGGMSTATVVGGTVGVEMNAWFEALGRRFAAAAVARGTPVPAPELD